MALSTEDTMYKDICSKIEMLEERIKVIEATENERFTRDSKDFFKKNWNEWMEFYEKRKMWPKVKSLKNNQSSVITEEKVERTIILFGVSYSKEKTEEQKKIDDEKKAKEILKEIGFNIEDRKICECIGIDRFVLNSTNKISGPFPIRVRLESVDSKANLNDLANKIKKASKNLKKSIKFQEIIVGVDLNEIQIAQFMRLLNKRRELNSQLVKVEVHRLLKGNDKLKSTMETITKPNEVKKSTEIPSITSRRLIRNRTKEYRASIDIDSKSLQINLESLEIKTPISKYWSGSLKLPHEQPFNQFVDKLGPGQKVSRQVLGSPYLGEIRLILFEEENKLSITVMEARNLKDSKRLNSVPYYHGGILKIAIWGDYGKLDRKVFMGIAQIKLDELDLSNYVDGWYTLWDLRSKMETSSFTGDELML